MNIIENILTGIVIIALLWFVINLKDNALYQNYNDTYKKDLKKWRKKNQQIDK